MSYCECICELKAKCTFLFLEHYIMSKQMIKKNPKHSCREFQLIKLCRYLKILPKFTPILILSTQNHFCMLTVRMKLHVTVPLFTHKPFTIPFPVIPRSINPTCQHRISLILTVEDLKCCYERLIQRLEAAPQDGPSPC